MWANTCWGLFGTAVALALAMLGLPPQYAWLQPWLLCGAVLSAAASVLCFSLPWWRHLIAERIWSRCSTIAPRIPLLDLLHEAEAAGWSLQNRDVLQRFAHGLRQAAADKTIEIWGLDLKNGWDLKSAPRIHTSDKICATYFKDHWIKVQQALVHQLNAYTRTRRPADNEPRFFSDLHVNRIQSLEWLRSEGILLRDTSNG